MPFNAEEYWATRKVKVWVVKLRSTRSRPETRYIRARTSKGAIDTAKYHSLMKGSKSGTARLATPTDLGAVATKQ